MSHAINTRRAQEDALFHEVISACIRYEFLLTEWEDLIARLGIERDIVVGIMSDADKPLVEKIRQAFERWRMYRGGTILSVCQDLENVLRDMKLTRIAEDVEELCAENLGEIYRQSKENQSNHEKEGQKLAVPASGAQPVCLNREISMTDLRPRHPPPGSVVSPPQGYHTPTKRNTLPLTLADERARLLHDNFIQCEYIELPKSSRSHLPVDMTHLPDGRLVVCDHHNECLYILALAKDVFNLQRTIRGKDNGVIQKPLRVATWRDLLLVSSSGRKDISVYSVVSDTLLASMNVEMDPLALAVYGDTLYVGGQGRIVRFSMTKTDKRIMCIREMSYSLTRSDAIVQYITCGSGGKLIASTGWSTNEIILWHVSKPQPIAAGTNLADPKGLAMLDDENLLVVEWRLGNVSVVRIRGNEFTSHIRNIIPANVQLVRPSCIHCLNPDMIIVVTGDEKKLAVFRRK
ncbi:uncharacterized protein LOC141903172 [Tubulanus polymorphus]|uniref:uncharacterized protein LOC141903172 n=1 Tax=Tubulanus polymorphus TaxID=672921 RepID=UPI003DA400D6